MSKDNPLAKELFTVGAHFGYSRTRRHPSTAKHVFATKNKVDIIDIEKTAAQLDEAAAFVRTLGEKGKSIIFVGTKPEAKDATRAVAEILGMPFVTSRWVGGILTNFPEI